MTVEYQHGLRAEGKELDILARSESTIMAQVYSNFCVRA